MRMSIKRFFNVNLIFSGQTGLNLFGHRFLLWTGGDVWEGAYGVGLHRLSEALCL